MFSSQQVNIDSEGYDFTKTENAHRWKGLFSPALKKVLEQVHPRLTAKEDALFYVETLCLRILAMLCAKPSPHTVQDVEEKVKKTFPAPIDCWALTEAKETVNAKKRKAVLPVDRVHSILQKDVLQYKIDNSVSSFLVAVLEYISADILKLAGNYVRKIKHSEICREDIEVAMCADKVLMDMFYQTDLNNAITPSPLPLPAPRAKLSYEEVVKELIQDEKQYQRDLHMIIRVFREELFKIVRDVKELDAIFSNIMDIYEITVTLLGSLEDVIEMSQEQSIPCVGSCFEELAEAEEFDVYTKYAQEVTSQQSKDALTTLLAKPDAMSLMSAGHGFREAVKYYLPKLLLVPIWHSFLYLDYIKSLMELSPSQEDKESFEQVQGLLRPLRCDLENIVANLPKEICIPMNSRARRQLAIERTRDLQTTVEHWDKDIGQNCNEFIREDTLGKLGSGKRIAERKVYLFDGLLVLCKPNAKRQTVASGGTTYEFRLKEKFFMRRVEISDRIDTEELKHSFEIAPRVHPPVILLAKNSQHKNDWMADLIMVNTKSMLDRILDSILLDIEKKHPLRLPTSDIYKFAVPDSPENIVLEERETAGVPLIKGATLSKLIERLTYHIYADPMFVRTFLTTYRYFCSPQNLLLLLIERFNIPDPSLVYFDIHQDVKKDLNSDSEKIHKNSQREDWKRYRKEFVQPVQFRVLNVLRHWVDHHFYDFEKDFALLDRLLLFLENVNGKSMRKWVDSVLKIVQRKNEQEKSHKQITFAYGHSPPPIEHHLKVADTEINLLTLHPLELARQLTLLEFELYKNVKPSELVGSPWTKKDKDLKSPNLLKIMKHTTNVTRWIEKSIIGAENYEERVAMVTRAIEVMMVMLELNNFNGILSISAAMGSASVYRLKLTFQGLPARYERFLEECRELNDGHLKKYQEKLRSINPPCVPFFGRYLTNILHLEEGNPDFLPNTELINFSKRRKVAEIIGEIQQYQNQPYCLMIDTKIRNFLENLDPFKGMTDTDISNLLYHKSLRIEPRGCKQPPKFPRKWVAITLKSPGIKPRRQNNGNNNSSIVGSAILPTSLTFAPKIFNQIHEGEQSPPDTCTNNSNTPYNAPVLNDKAFTVFANVNIPEQNGPALQHLQDNSNVSAMHTQQICTVVGPLSSLATNIVKYDEKCDLSGGDSLTPGSHLPELPKRDLGNSTISNDNLWGNDNTVSKSVVTPIGSSSPQTDICSEQILAKVLLRDNQSNSNNNLMELINESLPSPAPMFVVSPKNEINSKNNRSPIQNASNNRSSTSYRSFSPSYDESNTNPFNLQDFSCLNIASVGPKDHLNFVYGPTSSLCAQIEIHKQSVPVSPHVNVPTTYVEYKATAPPPPLPPRRRDKSGNSADIAQKRQAPDAPTLPPRDGEFSPPPVPPRIQHSIFPRTNDFKGKNSLLQPNTSSIMIRRNSAMKKKLPINSEDLGISSTPSTLTTTPPLTPVIPSLPHILTSFAADSSQLSRSNNSSVSVLSSQQFIGERKSFFRTSPKLVYSPTENTPKLPPKPSLSGNFYNNTDKATMFLYPSTNHE